MLAGFFHHQFEPQFEIDGQFLGKAFQRKRVIYKLLHDEVNRSSSRTILMSWAL
jgi:hypothetical protein